MSKKRNLIVNIEHAIIRDAAADAFSVWIGREIIRGSLEMITEGQRADMKESFCQQFDVELYLALRAKREAAADQAGDPAPQLG